MDTLFWKLTSDEVLALARSTGLPRETAETIIARSDAKPAVHRPADPDLDFDRNPIRVPLNRAGTIFLQSIHFIGEAGPQNPHYYAGEVFHTTTNAAFSGFLNRIGWRSRLFRRLAWTY